ncbi:hypothetical protein BJX64DRAFT_266669 [Aspergillus heterothallicus]
MAAKTNTLFSKAAAQTVLQLETCTKCKILNAFWPHLELSPQSFVEEEYAGFLQYIGQTLQDLSPHDYQFAAQSFESLFGIIFALRDNPFQQQTDLIISLKRSYLNTSDTAICRSIHLAIQLWLCLNVYCSDVPTVGALNPRGSRFHWSYDQPLDEIIAPQFPSISKVMPVITYQIDDSFTLANLKKICRLHIRWTSNLGDHLRLEGKQGERTLSVFKHRIFLVNHYNSPVSIIPKPILREALLTLDLLLPYGDAATIKLLKQSKKVRGVPLEGRDSYNLEEFTYWRSNLVQLFDLLHGPPESLFQTLRDTRNWSQWATVWVAIFGIFILTLVFGVLTTVYSISQYRVSVDSYKITLRSYELSLAVACQQRTGPLSGFCG